MPGKLAKLEKAHRQNPDVPFFARLADFYLSQGKIHKALSLCEKGCERFPDYIAGFTVLSKCYEAQGELEEARKAVARALRLDPENPGGFRRLSKIYIDQGNPEFALKSLQQAAHIDPYSEEVNEELDQLSAITSKETIASTFEDEESAVNISEKDSGEYELLKDEDEEVEYGLLGGEEEDEDEEVEYELVEVEEEDEDEEYEYELVEVEEEDEDEDEDEDEEYEIDEDEDDEDDIEPEEDDEDEEYEVDEDDEDDEDDIEPEEDDEDEEYEIDEDDEDDEDDIEPEEDDEDEEYEVDEDEEDDEDEIDEDDEDIAYEIEDDDEVDVEEAVLQAELEAPEVSEDTSGNEVEIEDDLYTDNEEIADLESSLEIDIEDGLAALEEQDGPTLPTEEISSADETVSALVAADEMDEIAIDVEEESDEQIGAGVETGLEQIGADLKTSEEPDAADMDADLAALSPDAELDAEPFGMLQDLPEWGPHNKVDEVNEGHDELAGIFDDEAEEETPTAKEEQPDSAPVDADQLAQIANLFEVVEQEADELNTADDALEDLAPPDMISESNSGEARVGALGTDVEAEQPEEDLATLGADVFPDVSDAEETPNLAVTTTVETIADDPLPDASAVVSETAEINEIDTDQPPPASVDSGTEEVAIVAEDATGSETHGDEVVAETLDVAPDVAPDVSAGVETQDSLWETLSPKENSFLRADDNELINLFQEIESQDSQPEESSEVSHDLPDPPDLDNQIATETLAEIYSKQGMVQRASEIYQQILQQDPDNEEIKRKLDNLSQHGSTTS